MKDRSHIVWPAAVIVLLLGSVVTMFGILYAATSDGGVQVVDRYYEKAAGWDSVATIRKSSNALNWVIHLRVVTSDGQRIIKMEATDAAGGRIDSLTGHAVISRPQRATPIAEHHIRALQGQPGYYGIDFPYTAPGLWDISLDMTAGTDRLVRSIRIEL